MVRDQTNYCDALQPRLAAFALGEVEADREVLDHLSVCSECRSAAQQYTQVSRLLPYVAPVVTPPPELRERVLAAATAPARTTPRPATRSVGRPRWRWGFARPALAFACAALLAMLGWNLSLQAQLNAQTQRVAASRANWQTMTALLNAPDVRVYALAGNSATGHFWATPDDTIACLVVEGLPDPGAGKVYQIWLMQGDRPISAGTFDTQAGSGWTLIRAAQPINTYRGVGVTVEPAGGSAAPTGADVLQGALSRAEAAPALSIQPLVAPPTEFHDEY